MTEQIYPTSLSHLLIDTLVKTVMYGSLTPDKIPYTPAAEQLDAMGWCEQQGKELAITPLGGEVFCKLHNFNNMNEACEHLVWFRYSELALLREQNMLTNACGFLPALRRPAY